jgi:hypothetical protein
LLQNSSVELIKRKWYTAAEEEEESRQHTVLLVRSHSFHLLLLLPLSSSLDYWHFLSLRRGQRIARWPRPQF